jgi:LysR family transcriptional regulator of beta-lactamase
MTGPTFDSSVALAHAAAQGAGVALLPIPLFVDDLSRKRLVRPYDTRVSLGSYWLTSLKSKRVSPAMQAFRDWLLAESNRSRRSQPAGP